MTMDAEFQLPDYRSMVGGVAEMLSTFRTSLVEGGFSREEALELAKELLHAMIQGAVSGYKEEKKS